MRSRILFSLLLLAGVTTSATTQDEKTDYLPPPSMAKVFAEVKAAGGPEVSATRTIELLPVRHCASLGQLKNLRRLGSR